MSAFIDALVRFRYVFLLGSLLLVAFAAAGLRQFQFDGSPRVFFAQGNPDYERYLAMEDTYGRDLRMFIMASAKQGDLFDPASLQALQELTDRVWELPFVRRVDSLSNFQYTYSVGDDLFVEDLLGAAVVNDPQALVRRKSVALQDPDIVNRLVSRDGRHAAVLTALNMTTEDIDTPAGRDLVDRAYALEQDIKARYPNIDIAMTGSLLSTHHNMQVARSDLGFTIPVMYGLMFLILGLLLRSVSSVIVTLVLALLSALGAMGLSAWLGLTFSILSVNALIISIIVAVAHCIHIFTQLFTELRTRDKASALAATLRVNLFAISMTSLTTVIGFLSLNTNDLPPATVLGNAAAIGTALAWLFSLTLLPALVMLLPFKAHNTSERVIDRWMNALAAFLVQRKYAVLIVMTLLSVLALYLSSRNQLNDILTETLHEPHIFRSDTNAINEHFGALYVDSFDLDSGEEYGIVDPAYLKNMDKFASWLRTQPEVTSVNAFSDTIKRLNQSMHGDDPAYYSIPDNRELIAQYLLMYEMSLPFGLDLGEQVTPDRRRSLLVVSMPVLDTQTDIALDQRIWAWQQEHLPPQMQNRNISLSNIWSYLTMHSLTNSLQGSLVALVLISFVLLFMLKSLRYGIISLIPNLLPAAFGFGFWYLYSGKVGLGLTCVLILTIGIVVDDTVHFLVKYKKALQENQGDTEQAVLATFRQVGSALFMTTAVLAAGFTVLGMSKIVINSALGQVTTVILVAAFLLDVLLLPVLLMIFDRNRKQQYQTRQIREGHTTLTPSVQGSITKVEEVA